MYYLKVFFPDFLLFVIFVCFCADFLRYLQQAADFPINKLRDLFTDIQIGSAQKTRQSIAWRTNWLKRILAAAQARPQCVSRSSGLVQRENIVVHFYS